MRLGIWDLLKRQILFRIPHLKRIETAESPVFKSEQVIWLVYLGTTQFIDGQHPHTSTITIHLVHRDHTVCEIVYLRLLHLLKDDDDLGMCRFDQASVDESNKKLFAHLVFIAQPFDAVQHEQRSFRQERINSIADQIKFGYISLVGLVKQPIHLKIIPFDTQFVGICLCKKFIPECVFRFDDIDLLLLLTQSWKIPVDRIGRRPCGKIHWIAIQERIHQFKCQNGFSATWISPYDQRTAPLMRQKILYLFRNHVLVYRS
ncbi:MAG: hypothetical protein C5S49_02040 [Candidatus Methanogaster sp.]|nr:MAG: hypothetical protein C5S49_02040 [ANME-2 cluster archaeon]